MNPGSLMFINRVVPPAEGATGEMLYEFAEGLANRGWQVTIVTSGARESGDDHSEWRAGIRLVRVRGFPFTRTHHLLRAVAYGSLYPLLLWRVARLPRPDILVTMTDPPLQLLLGPSLQRLKQCRLVHWAQDIYPELAEALGVLKPNGWIAQQLRQAATRALRRYDRVVVVGRCMKRRMLERGIADEKLRVIPNWALRPSSSASGFEAGTNRGPGATDFRREHGIEDRFVVMYAGNLGLGHNLTILIDAAEHLQTSLPNAVLVFVGDGAQREGLCRMVESKKLHNVRFVPRQPSERLGDTLRSADLHLVTMREDLGGLMVPSKIYGVLAAGRPCLFLGPAESEAAILLREHGWGMTLTKAAGSQVACDIARWVQDPKARALASERASNASRKLTAESAIEQFDSLFQELQAQVDPAGTR